MTPSVDLDEAGLRAAAGAWAAVDPDPLTRAALDELVAGGDTAALADHVGRRLAFGTAGLRGALGPGPNRMNRLVVRQTAAGLAAWWREATGSPSPVVVGHDARHRSADFAADVSEVLRRNGIDVLAFDGPVPTPLVAVTARLRRCPAVMVTASHNPARDNGLKVYGRDGAQLRPPADGRVADHIRAVADRMATHRTVAGADAELAPPGTPHGRATDLGSSTAGDAADEYVRTAVAVGRETGPPPPVAVPTVPLALTALHGVGAALADRVLRAAGHTDLRWVPGQRDPDPDFPTVRFPNPEEPGALDALFDLARGGAALALALDPDADRLGVAAPDGHGRWQAMTGDQVGAVLTEHLLGRAEVAGRTDLLVVTTVVSSRLAARIGRHHGAHVVETLTGFKWLSRPAEEHPDWTQVLAYEEALGYAVGSATRDKDGITAALVMADLASTLAAAGRSPWDLLDDLERRHGVHVTRNGSVPVTGPGWEDRLAGLVDRIVAAPPTHLGGRAVVRTDRPAPDVLRLWTDDDSRVAMRPSGTEPKLKYYCEAVVAVGDSPAEARREAGRRLDAVLADVTALTD